MICRRCEAEISDKALICYQCGASTEDPGHLATPKAGRERRSLEFSLAGLAILVLAGAFMGQVVTGDVPRWVPWTLAALAAALLIWRVARRGAR
ncbi:MAG: hypothetical protein AB1806_07615 [Acidobacteriota bacterium]